MEQPLEVVLLIEKGGDDWFLRNYEIFEHQLNVIKFMPFTKSTNFLSSLSLLYNVISPHNKRYYDMIERGGG